MYLSLDLPHTPLAQWFGSQIRANKTATYALLSYPELRAVRPFGLLGAELGDWVMLFNFSQGYTEHQEWVFSLSST